jgi:hypothetical protein
MGTYLYNLRTKHATVHTSDGPQAANLFSYAYKEWLTTAWERDVERRRQFIRRNAERVAQRAWETTEHRLVILGDKPEEGAPVYGELTSPVWFDTGRFPGQLLGFLRRCGRRWVLSDRSFWQPRQRDGIRFWVRQHATQGTSVQESHVEAPGERVEPAPGDREVWHIAGTPAPELAASRLERTVQIEY